MTERWIPITAGVSVSLNDEPYVKVLEIRSDVYRVRIDRFTVHKSTDKAAAVAAYDATYDVHPNPLAKCVLEDVWNMLLEDK